MNTAIRALPLLLLAGVCASEAKLTYPTTRTTQQVDVYHGVAVADPYRWLEDDNAPETKAWVEAQNRVTFDYLQKIPQRQGIRNRLQKLWNSSATACLSRKADAIFSPEMMACKIKA